MSKRSKVLSSLFGVLVCTLPGVAAPVVSTAKPRVVTEENTRAILWRPHADMRSLNLFYGPGGKIDAPKGTVFQFVKEDMTGTNPKFTVRDAEGVKWKVKLGVEAKPETVATRLLWAAGYTADEDYFVPTIQVNGMPHLRRGNQFVKRGGIVQNARLERDRAGIEKVDEWKWADNPFVSNRQLNGLRVMMALINNWDLKTINNGVLERKNGERIYMVTDVGASFGSAGFAYTQGKAKGNLHEYERSSFITKVTPEYVDFKTPAAPSLLRIFGLPAFVRRLGMLSIGRHVPREDARWMGDVLAHLSREQIADAFRAAAYTPTEVDRYTRAVMRRISELEAL